MPALLESKSNALNSFKSRTGPNPMSCVNCKRPYKESKLNDARRCSWCFKFQNLPEQLQVALEALEVDKADQGALHAFLGPLKVKEGDRAPTYEHSLRVGLTAAAIGTFMGVDARALLFAGLMHDIGKALVLMSVLGKTQNWTDADSKEMECHVTDSYRLLRGKFDFSAQVLVWHHQFQDNYYPKEIPPPLHPHSKGTAVTIAMYGRLLALADSYDALHRVNFQDGEVRARTDEEIRKLMTDRNPDQRALVENLYEAGVFV